MNARFKSARGGFTVVELLVGAAIASGIGATAYFVLTTGLGLYAKNFSLNNTHLNGRTSIERIRDVMHSAAGAAQLVSEVGEPVSDSGPAAGIRVAPFNRSGFYVIPNDVSASASTFAIQVGANQQAPKRGDIVLMNDLGLQAEIAGVSGSGETRTVMLNGPAGKYLRRPVTSGIAIPSGISPNQARCKILNQAAFIAVDRELRYYPSAMSVSADGLATFNQSQHYRVITSLLPPPGQQALPFSYADASRQTLDVNLRVESRKYSNRQLSRFLTFANFRTSIASRSASFIR